MSFDMQRMAAETIKMQMETTRALAEANRINAKRALADAQRREKLGPLAEVYNFAFLFLAGAALVGAALAIGAKIFH